MYIYRTPGSRSMLSTLLPDDDETVCCPTIHLITVDHGAVNQCQSPGSILLVDRMASAKATAEVSAVIACSQEVACRAWGLRRTDMLGTPQTWPVR